MQNETIIAGFGGQGVLFTGKVLAYAGLGRRARSHLVALLRA